MVDQARTRIAPDSWNAKGWPNFTFTFHDKEEIGPKMLGRIARRTGLTPEDL